MWTRPVTMTNARVVTPGGIVPSIRFDQHVLSVGEPPKRGDAVVDLEGAFVLPGLINAHDHLELNHYGALKGRERYENASDWIADMQPALLKDPRIRAGRSHPLAARLFVGALKNLLAGTTTVAHHNPLYREIGRRFPVRVVRRYGWAHSFLLQRRPAGANGELGGDVRRRYRATPPDAPFMVHVGEGTDEAASAEFPRLEAVGCVGANTIIVHGVALRREDWRDMLRRRAGLVWCPRSNQFLFGRTLAVRALLDMPGADAGARVCLGSDSRLTGSRDLLDELRVAAASAPLRAEELLRMVTTTPAELLRLDGLGRLEPNGHADLLVLDGNHTDAATALLAARRSDVRLVMLDGQPIVGARSLEAVFRARSSATRAIVLDGTPRIADAGLARAIGRCPVSEPGVSCA